MRRLLAVIAVMLAAGCYWQPQSVGDLAPEPDATEREMRLTRTDSSTLRFDAAARDGDLLIVATDTGSVRIRRDSIARLEARNTLLGGLPVILLGVGGFATFLSLTL